MAIKKNKCKIFSVATDSLETISGSEPMRVGDITDELFNNAGSTERRRILLLFLDECLMKIGQFSARVRYLWPANRYRFTIEVTQNRPRRVTPLLYRSRIY